MNYNNYYNPNGYNAYGMNFQQPQQNNFYQRNNIFAFVNGIEGAKNYIVGPNQTVYLKDSESNLLFEKKADHQGLYSMKVFELREVNKENDNDYVKKTDLKAFEDKLNNLYNLIEKTNRNEKNNQKSQNN